MYTKMNIYLLLIPLSHNSQLIYVDYCMSKFASIQNNNVHRNYISYFLFSVGKSKDTKGWAESTEPIGQM